MVLRMPRPYKHRRTGVYYFRRIVPEAMRPLVGKAEVHISLRTKDPREAARRWSDVAGKVDAEWEALRDQPPAPPFRYARYSDPQDRLDEAMLASGVLDERDLPEDWEPPPEAGLSAEGRLATSAPPNQSVLVTLTDILEGWWREAKAVGRKPSTFESYRNTITGLTKFLEADRPADHEDASKVTPEDVVRFKDHRLANGISAKTVKDSDLAGLKTVFGWAVTNRRLAQNPATGITIKLAKPAKLRSKGFTDVEARAILSAALKVDARESKTKAALHWVPWLAAYTGARSGELAQLRRQDVEEIDGVWLLKITPEAGTVKTNEVRLVPLHSHLIDLGFPTFVQQSADGPLFLRRYTPGTLQALKNRLAEFARGIVKRAGPDRLNRIPRRLSGLLPGLVLCNFARGA
jgi:integrase